MHVSLKQSIDTSASAVIGLSRNGRQIYLYGSFFVEVRMIILIVKKLKNCRIRFVKRLQSLQKKINVVINA